MPEAITALAAAARDGRLVVWTGAGLSMLPPSRSPSWWEIYQAVALALADQARQSFGDRLPPIDVEALLAPMSTQQVADLVVSRFAGETFTELLTVVDVADPNAGHRALARLAAAHALRAVLTTNFDTLIERAAAVAGVSMAVTAPGMAARTGPADPAILVKIHGTTVHPPSMIETSAHKARAVAEALQAAWLPALSGSVLLVVGYSGADLDFGAAQTFFADALAADVPIYWLYRPGSKPSLPSAIAERTQLIEGSLPFPLTDLCDTLGLPDFDVPLTGRDAKAQLARAVQDWVRRGHIGGWAAVTFFLLLCQRTESGKPLDAALMRLAREKAKQIQSDAELDARDIGVVLLLGAAGILAFERLAHDDARAMMEAAQQAKLSVHAALTALPGSPGWTERLCELAGGWNNLAFLSLVDGDREMALRRYRAALVCACEGGHPIAALVALGNVLAVGFELRAVRRCMRLAEAALELADRIGAIEPSINLRLLLALYGCDRNELWLARARLDEARRRAEAVSDRHLLALADLARAEVAIRTGRIEWGLNLVAQTLAAHPDAAFLTRPVEEIRRYLEILGIESPGPFRLRLDRAEVAGHVERIAEVRRGADADGSLAWGGKHCRVSPSAATSEDDLTNLFALGLLEFDGDDEAAADLGAHIAELMLDHHHYPEARWAARNVLARDARGAAAARALGVTAVVAAATGRIEQARADFGEAERAWAALSQPPPAGLISAAIWFFVQDGDAVEGARWAGLWREALSADRGQAESISAEAIRLDAWGPAAAGVASTLRAMLGEIGIEVPSGHSTEGVPYRCYTGASRPDAPADEAVAGALRDAASAIAAGDFAAAASLLGRITDRSDISERQLSAAAELTLRAFVAGGKADEAEAAAATLRAQFAEATAFNALASLEASMWLIRQENGQAERATEAFDRRGWIAELADQPITRMRLLLCGLAPAQDRPPSAYIRDAVRAVDYFGLGAGLIERARALAADDGGAEADRILVQANQRLAAAATAEAADMAVREAVTALRKARRLTPARLARLQGNRAVSALEWGRFDEARRLFLRVEAVFGRLGMSGEALTALAGAARSASRGGDHQEAVRRFEEGIGRVGNGAMRSDFLRGLGAAHLLQANRAAEPDTGLLARAAAAFSDAVAAAGPSSLDRATARLGLARALGELGEQDEALEAFDTAVSELAHLGRREARLLIEHRGQFRDGHWAGLGVG